MVETGLTQKSVHIVAVHQQGEGGPTDEYIRHCLSGYAMLREELNDRACSHAYPPRLGGRSAREFDQCQHSHNFNVSFESLLHLSAKA
eukprot:6491275-Amphidinium_carterae.1